MMFGFAQFSQFGLFARLSLLPQRSLFAPKSQDPDFFDLRLQRIGNRERHRLARPILFRPQPLRLAV